MSPRLDKMSIKDLSPGYSDFAKKSSQIMTLDLVLTVAAVNLAVELGARAWVPVPYILDWRGELHGDATRWYRSARIYLYCANGGWRSVLRNIAHDVARLPQG